MSTVAEPRTYTPEDLLELPDGDQFELVNGELVSTEMGTKAGYVATELIGQIRDYNRVHPHGWPFGEGVTYQCFPDVPGKVRKPDASFVRFGRFPNEELPTGHTTIAPDLAAEVLSPNDLAYDVEEKVREYQEAGIQLIWVIDPERRTVRVHRLDGGIAFLREYDELDGENVLPGFRCKVAELFRTPVPPPTNP